MIKNLIRQDLLDFSPYISARDELYSNEILLNANEYPIDDCNKCNRYPEQQPKRLLSKLGELFKISSKNILATRGSDEAIDLLIRLFCQSGQDKIMICTPTYGMYKVSAKLQGAQVIEIPLNKTTFDVDIDKTLNAWEPNCKILFLCSPNNPTGNTVGFDTIKTLCQQFPIVVIDEAYIDFSTSKSATTLLQRYDNLVVLRTLSKAYGLAGLRCGAIIASVAIITWLKRIMAPYPIPTAIIDIITNIDCNPDIQKIVTERELLYQKLQEYPFVKNIWASQANFILFKTNNCPKIIEYLKNNGILLRYFSEIDCIRITVGTPMQNKMVLEALNYYGDNQ